MVNDDENVSRGMIYLTLFDPIIKCFYDYHWIKRIILSE